MTDRSIQINRLDEWPGLAGLEERLRAAAEAALATSTLEAVELSLTLLPAEEMRTLNRTYHGVDAATDVLAFDLGGLEPDARRSLLADLYVCPDEARRSAREEGVPVREELTRLVIHGVLHLLGHDHPEASDRDGSEMFRLQERLLASLRDEG